MNSISDRIFRASNSAGSRAGGFSTLELVLTVAALGVIATVSAIAIGNVSKNTQRQKLESDVHTLNSAIQIYLSNGGNLAGVASADDVLARLKTSRSKADKERHVGATSGKMIDSRVTTSPVAADSWKARAEYVSADNRFEIVTGRAGVEFVLDDSLAEAPTTLENRDDLVLYAESSTWVWDHAATVNPDAPDGAADIPTRPDVEDSTPGEDDGSDDADDDSAGNGGGSGAGNDDGDSSPKPPRLPRPRFSEDGGAHPESDFPLSVLITNVPPAADADAEYRIDSGDWQPYTGPVTIPMNTSLRARFLAKDPEAYRDSRKRHAYYYPVPESLSGSVDGDFHSPSGGANLVYEITNNGDFFSHGDPIYVLDGIPVDSGDPNTLQFQGKSFSNVAPGEVFKLGDLDYHNGNSYYDSHATAVDLRITMTLPERNEVITFDLNLDLVNTENDPDDPAASADYVKITNLQQNIPLQINDVRYKIILEFGATDSFGFSSSSQFHVYEGATGKGELLGRIVPK